MIPAMTAGGARGGRRVATALLLVLLAAACTNAGRWAVSWQRVEPGGATRCARGGRYAFWARVADPNKLVVFLQGGGGCFDERSCAVGSGWFDDSVTDADDPTHAGGMLAMADPRNPFRDWSWVFVPSCGGDVHLGDRRVR
jgi:Pectinacetylesterase